MIPRRPCLPYADVLSSQRTLLSMRPFPRRLHLLYTILDPKPLVAPPIYRNQAHIPHPAERKTQEQETTSHYHRFMQNLRALPSKIHLLFNPRILHEASARSPQHQTPVYANTPTLLIHNLPPRPKT